MNKPPDPPRKALGKGLNALLPARRSLPALDTASPSPITHLPTDAIAPNPVQPRSTFDSAKIAELAQSIRANGIIQPLIVRLRDGHYQLVAGERRWRAAKLAELTEVPVVIKDVPDEHLLEISLIENIQREDLNPIEVAKAFEAMTQTLGLTHEQIAQRTGKDRTTISNMLRLLRLPQDIQQLVAENRLSMGHARAILGLPTEALQREVAQKTVSQGLSVREVERLIHRMTEPREPKPSSAFDQDPNVKSAVEALQQALGTKVRIVPRDENRGHIEIEYYSQEELHRLYAQLVGEPEER